MAYGKHQSFYLKNNWINKGLKAINEDPKLFSNSDNFLAIGIGKNMFSALKYWLEALNLIKTSNNNDYKLTDFGEFVFSNDLSTESYFTLNLMHYYLTLNKPLNGVESSTGFYWFFNLDTNKIFKKQDILNDLVIWDTINFKRNTSEKTLEKELDCLFLLYTKSHKAHPEDKNTSPLADLELIKKDNEVYRKNPIIRKKLSKEVFLYALLMMIENNSDNKYIDLNSAMNNEMSPGKVFNLDRVDFVEVIEEMINDGYPLQIVRTNNLDTISISADFTAEDYINSVYRQLEGTL